MNLFHVSRKVCRCYTCCADIVAMPLLQYRLGLELDWFSWICLRQWIYSKQQRNKMLLSDVDILPYLKPNFFVGEMLDKNFFGSMFCIWIPERKSEQSLHQKLQQWVTQNWNTKIPYYSYVQLLKKIIKIVLFWKSHRCFCFCLGENLVWNLQHHKPPVTGTAAWLVKSRLRIKTKTFCNPPPPKKSQRTPPISLRHVSLPRILC